MSGWRGQGLRATRRAWVLLFSAFVLPNVACTAQTYKVRKAEGATLCARRLLVVVEDVQGLEIARLHDPLEAELSRQGAEVRVVGAPVEDLRNRAVSDELLRMTPDALLVIDIGDSSVRIGVVSTTLLEYKMSLYEYTRERQLVEVWKAKAHTARQFTYDLAIGDAQAQALAEVLAADLQESEMLFPCRSVEVSGMSR